MKKVLFILSLIFLILSFIGMVYMLYNKANVGFTLIPLLISIVLSIFYRKLKDN